MENKTNKIIHYCWFGGNPLSELTKKCIETWKRFLPDFEIKEWNEKNFDVTQCTFVKEAYEQKKWAFVADYCRFKVLEEYGGMYLDTDMEITKDVSKYLEHELFLGCEDSKMINAAVVWAKEPHNKDVSNIVKIYESMEKFNPTDDLYDMSVPRVLTSYFEKYGFDKELDKVQVLDNGNVHIYPMEYFYPLSYDYQHNKFTDNSCMIHHFDATWISKMELFKTKMKRKNMTWVVYIIDFFINIKNKIRFFCNYRDISIFVTMFLIMMACMFAIKPISIGNAIFDFLNKNSFITVLQIILTSALWTFFCAKVSNINLNSYCDKMTNRDTNSEVYKEIKLNLEQTMNFQKAQRRIFTVEYILTLIFALFPALEIFTIISNSVQGVLYFVLMSLNVYYLYMGISKKFKYRILELVPYAIVLSLLVVVYPSTGILISILTFGYVLYNLIKNKVKTRRTKFFVISYLVALIVFLTLNLVVPNINNMKKLEFSSDILKFERVKEYDIYLEENNEVTEFNVAKDTFSKRIDNLKDKSSIFLFKNLYVYLAIILSAILVFINKKREYIFFAIITVLNSLYVMQTDIHTSFYFIIFMCFVLALYTIQSVINRFLNK